MSCFPVRGILTAGLDRRCHVHVPAEVVPTVARTCRDVQTVTRTCWGWHRRWHVPAGGVPTVARTCWVAPTVARTCWDWGDGGTYLLGCVDGPLLGWLESREKTLWSPLRLLRMPESESPSVSSSVSLQHARDPFINSRYQKGFSVMGVYDSQRETGFVPTDRQSRPRYLKS